MSDPQRMTAQEMEARVNHLGHGGKAFCPTWTKVLPDPGCHCIAEFRAHISAIEADNRELQSSQAKTAAACGSYRRRIRELEGFLDTPHTGEFFESVRREAGHQSKRWGTEHDQGKEPTDWLWLIGHLVGKAVNLPQKRKHHIISSAAVLLNWYRHETGDSSAFQPGIVGPK